MKINKQTPTEISLEKSSTGTWSRPEASKRKIKPWQYLWHMSAFYAIGSGVDWIKRGLRAVKQG